MRSFAPWLAWLVCAMAFLPVRAEDVLVESVVYPDAESVVPLAPGARVPSVQVESVDKQKVDLAELVREQGALLVFYRGGW